MLNYLFDIVVTIICVAFGVHIGNNMDKYKAQAKAKFAEVKANRAAATPVAEKAE